MSIISDQVKELRNYEIIFKGDRIDGNLSPIFGNAADTIEALSAKLAESSSGWIVCEDRLPEDFEVVLAFTEKQQIVTVARDGEDWVLYIQDIIKEKVLAWQPLPEPYRP